MSGGLNHPLLAANGAISSAAYRPMAAESAAKSYPAELSTAPLLLSLSFSHSISFLSCTSSPERVFVVLCSALHTTTTILLYSSPKKKKEKKQQTQTKKKENEVWRYQRPLQHASLHKLAVTWREHIIVCVYFRRFTGPLTLFVLFIDGVTIFWRCLLWSRVHQDTTVVLINKWIIIIIIESD